VSREIALAYGRAAAASGFIDTCLIQRAGTPVTDPLTGIVTTPTATVYEGVCRFQQAAAPWAGPATVAQAAVGLSALEIQLPVVGSEGVTKDDIVTCVTATHDADLVGKAFTIQGAHHASHKTTRRLPLMEVLS
jgi:hypothetical protein